MEPKYVIGIDLGTTNSALAFAEIRPDADPFAAPDVRLLRIPQLVNPGEVRDEDLLPSFLYLPGADGFPARARSPCPGTRSPDFVVGRLAQKRGVENAGRLVSSAKSWLSPRRAWTAPRRILPFRAPEGVPKLSPVEASRRYLEHLQRAWDAKMPDAPFVEQQVLVTVPASFDAVARELTQRAAEEAGYRNVTLLEEPQAAFYAWIERHARLARARQGGRPHPGGGHRRRHHRFHPHRRDRARRRTGARPRRRGRAHPAGRRQHRPGAGARGGRARWPSKRHPHRQLPASGAVEQLPHRQGEAAASRARTADGAAGHDPGQGHRPGGRHHQGHARAAPMSSACCCDGFFPSRVEHGDAAARAPRRACRRSGCPTRPTPPSRATWRASCGSRPPRPSTARCGAARAAWPAPRTCCSTAACCNAAAGARAPARRCSNALAGGGRHARRSSRSAGEDLMHAVSRGAAYYGLARRGRGVRIRGGVPRTYYVGIESAMPAVPGFTAPLKALTVVPFGMEEGTEAAHSRTASSAWWSGEPAEFRFFASAARKNDQPGDLIEDVGDELEELPPMEVELPAGENGAGRGAGLVRDRGHRNRHAATVVRGARRPPLEARIQRRGEARGDSMKIGIDLGTTNSALAYIDPREAEDRDFPPIHIFEIPQLVAPGRVEPRRTLPSFLFLEDGQPVGMYAREQGALVPTRLVHSAKSLAVEPRRGPHRQDPALGLAGDRARALAGGGLRALPGASSARSGTRARAPPLAEQDIVLTVPASFDEEARELTVMAAREAGLEKLTLLEEPAAAFYSWIANNLAQSRKQLFDGQMVLVCDVGGGTSDFSLIRVIREGDLVELHPHRRGPAPAAGRRQPGPHAGLAGGNQARHAALHPAAQRAAAAVLGGQGAAAARSASEERRDHRAGRRHVADRRLAQDRDPARRGAGTGARRLSALHRARRSAQGREAQPVPRAGPAVCLRPGHHART